MRVFCACSDLESGRERLTLRLPTDRTCARLPLDSILILISELKPKILDLPTVASSSSSTPLSAASPSPPSAISLLKSASLAGLLPPPPPPHPRRFVFSPQSETWLATIVYGSVYLSSLELVRQVQVQLFGVAKASNGGGGGGVVGGAGSEILRRGAGALGAPLEFVSGAASALFGRGGGGSGGAR